MPGLPPHDSDVYLLDFGLARLYRDGNGNVRPPRDAAGFRGALTSFHAALMTQ